MGIKDFPNYICNIKNIAISNADNKLKYDIRIGSTEHFRPSYNTISYNDIHRKAENIDDIKDITIHTLPKRLMCKKSFI